MDSINLHVIVVLIASIIVTYFTPIPLIENTFDVKYNANKLYNVLYLSFLVTLTDIILNRKQFSTSNFIIWLLLLTIFTLVIYYFIKEQIFINDKSYLSSMIDKHEIDIKMSEKILEHAEVNNDVKLFVTDIIKNRKKELNNIYDLLSNKKN